MSAIAPGEELLSLPSAIEKATGRRPHITTCHRWRLSGTNGIKLPTVKVGGRRLTSVAAVHRWIDECNEADASGLVTSNSHRRERAIAEAAAFLDTEGV